MRTVQYLVGYFFWVAGYFPDLRVIRSFWSAFLTLLLTGEARACRQFFNLSPSRNGGLEHARQGKRSEHVQLSLLACCINVEQVCHVPRFGQAALADMEKFNLTALPSLLPLGPHTIMHIGASIRRCRQAGKAL